MIIVYIFVFIVACVLLTRSVGSLIKFLGKAKRFLRLSEFTVAFILMAIATSLPELFVGISSALNKAPQLALGSLIGTNIVNLTLIVGLIAVASRGIRAQDKFVRRNLASSLLIGLVPFLMLIDGSISRVESAVLLLIFVVYITILFRKRERAPQKRIKKPKESLAKTFFYFFIALAVLLASSHLIVYSATHLAAAINIPLVFIGLIGLALGTSLPELAFGLKAALAEHKDMNLGNILGSTVTNVTLVLGIVGLVHPIKLQSPRSVLFTGIFTLIVFVLFFIFSYSRKKISRLEGLILALVYVVFVAVQFLGLGEVL